MFQHIWADLNNEFDIPSKLHHYRLALNDWAKSKFRSGPKKIRRLRDSLNDHLKDCFGKNNFQKILSIEQEIENFSR